MALLVDFEVRLPRGPVVRAAAEFGSAPVTVLFGPSGAGKTTILRAIAGLVRPASGRIMLGAECWFDAARGIDLPPQRRRLGYVMQEQVLFPHLSVERNIAYGIRSGAFQAPGERVRQMIDMLGLAGLERRRPAELSGGQRQRVAVARALAPSPRLLLLDEPLSSLDFAARAELRLELRRVLVAAAIPTVLVTHDPAEARELGDALASVDAGVLTPPGPVAAELARLGA
jgi:molybdate transport system ATP-binding protein